MLSLLFLSVMIMWREKKTNPNKPTKKNQPTNVSPNVESCHNLSKCYLVHMRAGAIRIRVA